MAKQTPLYDLHVKNGGRMVEFCGYMLPVEFGGIINEHEAVRQKAGMFDVSHMGRIDINGENAGAFIQRLTTNNVLGMQPGRIRYALLCNEQGGVKDDILVFFHGQGYYSLVVNAANAQKVLTHLDENRMEGAEVTDRTGGTGHIAFQGPLSEGILTKACGGQALPEKYYSFVDGIEIAGVSCFVSRNGYTGENGFEIIAGADGITAVCEAIMQAGGEEARYCGLGCRDTLRFEAGMPLYGHELGEDISPYEAGLGSFVKLDAGDFLGRAALERQLELGVPRKRIGLLMNERGIPRQGYAVYTDGKQVGTITSGSYCPTLEANCGMALVETDASDNEIYYVEIRGKMKEARIQALPFYTRRPVSG